MPGERLMSQLRAFAEAVVSRLPARLQPMARWRFIKFGMVGASGTVINMAVLYAAQEFLLLAITDFHTRLNFSIAMAITLATISNFYWNRRLTWRSITNPVAAIRKLRTMTGLMAGYSTGSQSKRSIWPF